MKNAHGTTEPAMLSTGARGLLESNPYSPSREPSGIVARTAFVGVRQPDLMKVTVVPSGRPTYCTAAQWGAHPAAISARAISDCTLVATTLLVAHRARRSYM